MESVKEMRQVLADCIIDAMKADDRVVLVDADLGKADGTLPVREAFPNRWIDVGVAEQNMASVAAGMAAYGKIPIINTFAAFASRRICDQIAISISYAGRNVKIIGTDPGIAAELNGGTHMAVEDVGVLRSIPNMLIFEPADVVELIKAFPAVVAHEGPVYMRMYRKKTEIIHDETYQFDLYRADVIKTGNDVTLVCSGIMVNEALEAGRRLNAEGIEPEIINIHTIKPLDEFALIASAKKTGVVVTCENHNILGGLRAAVAETLSRYYPVPVIPIGIPDLDCEVGVLPYLKERFGLTAAHIVNAARQAVEMKYERSDNRRF